MNSEEQFSTIVSEALDILGYNEHIVKARKMTYDNLSKIFTEIVKQQGHDGYVTVSGSKREGLAGVNESDMDLMITDNRVQCSDDPASVTRDVAYVFELDREGCPHGYTKLRLFNRNVNTDMTAGIEHSLIQYPDGSCYLSSALLMSKIMSGPHQRYGNDVLMNTSRQPQTGPSAPLVGQNPFSGSSDSCDRVISFSCQCSDYLHSWLNRPRDFDWPSRDQIEAASTLDAHVVPVGAKGSEDEHLQFRICYTLTEVNLMKSFNETQWKLYVALKMVRDLEFKPLDNLLTSYVLKNVIMWISESDPIEAFQPKYIIHKLRQCLDFLILGFRSKRIPNYMISDRNLLDGRLNDLNHREHLAALNKVRRNIPATILRCSKLKHAMVQVFTARSIARAEMIERNRLEILSLCSYALSPEYSSTLYSRLFSCSTVNAVFDVMMQVLSDHPEILANYLNIPVATAASLINRFRLLPTEVLKNLTIPTRD